MGGRGSSSGIVSKSGGNKWSYPGNDQRIQQLEKSFSGARSVTKKMAVASALTSLENSITAEINKIDAGYEKYGNKDALLSQRRKVRQLHSKVLKSV